jgi:hypothetical protein
MPRSFDRLLSFLKLFTKPVQTPVSNVANFLHELATIAPPAGQGSYAFLDEAGQSRGFAQFIIESDRAVTIHRLWTLRPNDGNGSAMLRKLCELADRHGVQIFLKALPFGRKPYPRSRDQLQQWYERHGFVGTRKKMIRVPQPAKSEVGT